MISPEDCVVIFADLQAGIADRLLTVDPDTLKRGVKALAKLTKIFSLPFVVSAVAGRSGEPAIMPEITDQLGDFPTYRHTSADSFANQPIAEAIMSTGRGTLLAAAVATEVAVQLLCLSASRLGLTAYVVIDACAGLSARTEDAALRRLSAGGVQPVSIACLAGELAGDFASAQGQAARDVLWEMVG